MTLKCVWIIPVFTFLIVGGTFIITYFVAVYNEHVVPVFPYISDTGTIPPESCIFAQLLNIGALFGCITVYLRHRQIVEVYHYSRLSKKWLIVASLLFMWLGFLSCLGMSLSANFQETSVIQVHMIGAFMAFGIGLLYAYGQTFLTYLLDRKIFVGLWVAHFRLLLCAFGTAFFILMNFYGFASNGGAGSPFLEYDWSSTTLQAITDEVTTSKSYLISAISEWAFAICTILFFLTFAAEFRKSILIPPRMMMKAGQNLLHDEPLERRTDPELGLPSTNVDVEVETDSLTKWRQNVFPEIRAPPPVYGSGQYKHYHSSDQIFNRNQPNYGSTEPATQTNINLQSPSRTWQN